MQRKVMGENEEEREGAVQQKEKGGHGWRSKEQARAYVPILF